MANWKKISATIIVASFAFFIYSLYKYMTHDDDIQEVMIKPKLKMVSYEKKKPGLLDVPLQKIDDTYITHLLQPPTTVYDKLREEVTVVTMYINIGAFIKGVDDTMYTPKIYRKWMVTFAFITNPVLAFFDKQEDLDYFANLRRRLDPSLTKTVLLDRNKLWSFSLQEQIRNIFNKPLYAKHYPNTVVPEYSCAMHTKYEVMQAATTVNYFQTRYFAWLDLGLFRSLARSTFQDIHVWLPPNFNDSSIAYTEVYERNPKAKPMSIVYANMVWVCGCFFIGTHDKLKVWSKEYIRATEALINDYDLMSTDQQVIYILFNFSHPRTSIQTYKSTTGYDEWFYLGYICMEQGKTMLQEGD